MEREEQRRDAADQHFQVDPDVVAQAMGEQMVLVHLRTNRIHSLNATALRLWELLSAGSSRSQLEERLLSEFDVDRATLQGEIDATLNELTAAGLVTAARDG